MVVRLNYDTYVFVNWGKNKVPKTNPAINVTLYLGHANSLTAQLLTSLIAHVKIDARYLVQKKV